MTAQQSPQKEAELFLEKQPQQGELTVKVYKRRWLILGIFMYYASVNSFQWIEYCVITPVVVKYYQVSTLTVDWTSIVYMAIYPILVIPASIVIDKKGLRTAALIGCIGTLLGTGIKTFSINRDLFPIVLLGQCIVSSSQLLIVCLPPKIAATWFKPSEVSTACSLGVFGTQFGCAIGYVLPPLLVKDSIDIDVIGEGFKILCWTLTALMVPAAFAVISYFPKQPPLAPSHAQAELREIKEEFSLKNFFKSVRKLLVNKGFVIHMVAYGINIACFSAIGTLLTQFILQYFEGANEYAGRLGFIMVICGMIGSIMFGILLDKTHKYKETTLFIYFFSATSVLVLLYTLEKGTIIGTYISCGLVGLFTNAYMPVGFELAMELTFPAEESTTTGILFSMTQLLGAIFTVFLGYLNLWVGCYWSLISQSALLFLGTLITSFVPNKLLRQEAFNKAPKELQKQRSMLTFIE